MGLNLIKQTNKQTINYKCKSKSDGKKNRQSNFHGSSRRKKIVPRPSQSYEVIISYLVVALDLFCRIRLLVSLPRATAHRRRGELHVASRVQMLLTLGMFARQLFGSVPGAELLLTLASVAKLLAALCNSCPVATARASPHTPERNEPDRPVLLTCPPASTVMDVTVSWTGVNLNSTIFLFVCLFFNAFVFSKASFGKLIESTSKQKLWRNPAAAASDRTQPLCAAPQL